MATSSPPTAALPAPALPAPDDPAGRAGRLLLWALLGGFGVAALLAAVLIPYHDMDSFLYGEWSRRIADSGTLNLLDEPPPFAHRPLFYVVQAGLWSLLGFDETWGRLLSLAFFAVLVGSMMALAGARRDRAGTHALLAAALLLAMPDVARYFAAGMTDIPVAAAVALTAALLWRAPAGRGWTVALVLAAAAAVLVKPTALPALGGLGLAHLLGSRDELAQRIRGGVLPLALGTALGLAYDVVLSAQRDLPLTEFLRSGTDGYQAQLVDLRRRDAVLGLDWLGPYLLVPLVFALVYAVARVAGVAHRRAATVSVPATVVLAWLLPYLSDPDGGALAGFLDPDNPGAILLSLAFLALLTFVRRCPEELAPGRVELARLLVWAVPSVLAWALYATYYTRFLAPAWPALVLLVAAVLWVALVQAGRWRTWAAVAAIAAVCAAGLLDLRNFDSLGARPDGSISALRALGDLPGTDVLDEREMLAIADPALAGEVAATAAAAGADGLILTTDGRLPFFFLYRVTVTYPIECADLEGFAAFTLLTERTGVEDVARLPDANADVQLLADEAGPSSQGYWEQRCADRGVRTAAAQPGAWAVFDTADVR